MMYMPGMNPDYLPQSMTELIDIIGLKATLTIVEERGGVRLFVPVAAETTHWLAHSIGMEAFEILVENYQREEIDIPLCVQALRALRESEIHHAAQSGETNAELARRYHYTERGIRKLRRRVEVREGFESQQEDMFSG